MLKRTRWRGLELPSMVSCDKETLTERYGKFIASGIFAVRLKRLFDHVFPEAFEPEGQFDFAGTVAAVAHHGDFCLGDEFVVDISVPLAFGNGLFRLFCGISFIAELFLESEPRHRLFCQQNNRRFER